MNKNLNLNKKLYKIKAIKIAIRDFSHLADFDIKKELDYYIVKMKNINKEAADVIIDEFCNYVLYLMKKL